MKNVKILIFLGNIVFLLTLFSPWIAMGLISVVGDTDVFENAGFIENIWIMWLLIPFGIVSIFIGLSLKRNKQKYKKNLIIAYIIIPFLIFFGSYKYIFSHEYAYNVDVTYIKKEINIDIPEQIKTVLTKDTLRRDEIIIKIIDEDSRNQFEKEIENNKVWKSDLGSKIMGILPLDIQVKAKMYDFFIFYNRDTKEYNSYPEDGEYEIVFVAYSLPLHKLIIIDGCSIDVH